MPVLSESQWRASVGKRVQCDKGVGKLMYFGITKNSKVRPTSALRPCSDPPKMTNFTSNHDCHPLPPPLPGDGRRHPGAKVVPGISSQRQGNSRTVCTGPIGSREKEFGVHVRFRACADGTVPVRRDKVTTRHHAGDLLWPAAAGNPLGGYHGAVAEPRVRPPPRPPFCGSVGCPISGALL